MSPRPRRAVGAVPSRRAFTVTMLGACVGAASAPFAAFAADYPVTAGQRATARQVAEAGVPLSELSPNAPDSHTVVPGDTLWGISGMFLRSPWRWPELWGMNLEQIRNPHLIYPGQVLYLDTTGGRARLRLAQPVGGSTVRLSPRIRASDLTNAGIPSIPLHLIQPFLNEAIVFQTNELDLAPRIVATPEGRVLVSRGDLAYVRGELNGLRDFRVFREARPLADPTTKEVLGFEAPYLGSAEFVRPGEERATDDGKPEIVPATISITTVRQEIGVGDRLAPAASTDYSNYTPHAPTGDLSGQVISIYGDGFTAGQNQIVALNRGRVDGMERGHVLAAWRSGTTGVDRTGDRPVPIRLPDERHGLLFVFSVFDRVSYALVLNVLHPITPGDRFTQP